MMKLTILLLATMTIMPGLFAQNGHSPFRKNYARLGIQNIGKKLDATLSPGSNILKGNTGTTTGFVFEKGRIFYFIPASKAKRINAGLDWTILSITYNPSAKAWKDYIVANSSSYTTNDFEAKFVGSISTKIGPAISINPVQDLVIDLRGQASIGAYIIGPLYESTATGTDNAFYPYKEDVNASGIKKFTQYLSTTGIKPNVGATVRWRSVGLAVDYSPGKVKMNYTKRNNGVETTGTENVTLNSMQVKLNLTL